MSRYLPDLAGTLEDSFRIADVSVRNNAGVVELREGKGSSLVDLLAGDATFGDGSGSVVVTIDHGTGSPASTHFGRLLFGGGAFIEEFTNPLVSEPTSFTIRGNGSTSLLGSTAVVIARHIPSLDSFYYANNLFSYSGVSGEFEFSSGIVRILENEVATSPTSGALQVVGGISSEESIYAGVNLSASKGFSGVQTLGIGQTLQNDLSNTVLIGDNASITGAVPSSNSIVIGHSAAAQNSLNPGGIILIGAGAYTNYGRCIVIGRSAGVDRSFGVTIGGSAYGGGMRNVVIGEEAAAASATTEFATIIGAWAYSDATEGTAIGSNSYVQDPGGVAVGASSAAHGGVAVGYQAEARSLDSVVAGVRGLTNSLGAVVIGSNGFVVGGLRSIALGLGAAVQNDDDLLQIGGNSANLAFTGKVGFFTLGETITGSTSGAVGRTVKVFRQDDNWITVAMDGATDFIIGETITGGASGATATTALNNGAGVDTGAVGQGISTVRFGRGLSPIVINNPIFYNNTTSGLSAEDIKSAIDELAAASTLNHFNPKMYTEDNIYISGTEGFITFTRNTGNLAAVDVDPLAADNIDFTAAGMTAEEVATVRVEIVTHTGQSITFNVTGIPNQNIINVDDLVLPADGTTSVLFDKPYGTTTWYARNML